MQAQATAALAEEYRLPVDGQVLEEIVAVTDALERFGQDSAGLAERMDKIVDHLTAHLNDREKMEFGKRLWGLEEK